MFLYSKASQIIKLYDRSSPEGSEEDQVPADVVHHFLLAICTRPGTGVCFKERGWYPRETDDDSKVDDEDETVTRTRRIYNKILANTLRVLKVNEDSRQQELALKILSACPELVARYVKFIT